MAGPQAAGPGFGRTPKWRPGTSSGSRLKRCGWCRHWGPHPCWQAPRPPRHPPAPPPSWQVHASLFNTCIRELPRQVVRSIHLRHLMCTWSRSTWSFWAQFRATSQDRCIGNVVQQGKSTPHSKACEAVLTVVAPAGLPQLPPLQQASFDYRHVGKCLPSWEPPSPADGQAGLQTGALWGIPLLRALT